MEKTILNESLSLFFTWTQALYLPSIKTYHNPSDEEKDNIITLAHQMDDLISLYCDELGIDEFLVEPVVHCWIRPTSVNPLKIYEERYKKEFEKFNYNLFIGSKSKKSAHIFGRAVDWHLDGYRCDDIRYIQQKNKWLEKLELRCEDQKGEWIHNDNYKVKYKRYFRP